MQLNTVNEHCLNGLLRLAERRTLTAADDIFDERGIKLWAKNQPVCADLQEKLLRRRLARPLEATLAVDGAVGFADVIAAAKRLVEHSTLLQRLAGGRGALAQLDRLRDVPIPAPLRSCTIWASCTSIRTISTVAGGLRRRSGSTSPAIRWSVVF